jgi:8-oxo-dGTP pyrophosphatase MutT (NUDIX family)
MIRRGTASIVFYKVEENNEIHVLVGKETKFLRNYKDILAECFGLEVTKLETWNKTNKEDEDDGEDKDTTKNINAHFTQEARTLTRFLNNNAAYLNSRINDKEYKIDFPIFVVYDQPRTKKLNNAAVKTNYRFLSPKYSMGVVKGGIEGAETAAEAACREIKEELNMTPDLRFMNQLCEKKNHHIFAYCVDAATAAEILWGAESMIRYENRGELVDLCFAPLSEVLDPEMKIRDRLNKMSLAALNAFANFVK